MSVYTPYSTLKTNSVCLDCRNTVFLKFSVEEIAEISF